MRMPSESRWPNCDWREEGGRRCVGTATWELRCAPRRADSRRGSWPGDVDLVRVCRGHLQEATARRRVVGPPTSLGGPD